MHGAVRSGLDHAPAGDYTRAQLALFPYASWVVYLSTKNLQKSRAERCSSARPRELLVGCLGTDLRHAAFARFLENVPFPALLQGCAFRWLIRPHAASGSPKFLPIIKQARQMQSGKNPLWKEQFPRGGYLMEFRTLAFGVYNAPGSRVTGSKSMAFS